jgi:hypothetical protein
MTKPVRFTQVTEALTACIAAAPEAERNALAQALMDWTAKYGQSYVALIKSAPATQKLLQAIEEGSDARIGTE